MKYKYLTIIYTCIYIYIHTCIYDSQIFILHINSFNNQGSKINKNDVFLHYCMLYI